MIHDPIGCICARTDRHEQTDGPPTSYTLLDYVVFVCACRGPLSLLAGMPSGNVVGLIELEGEPAQVFGGGQDGAEGSAGSGMERVARLSESEHDAVMRTLGWRCKARLAAGSWFLMYWQVSIHRLEGCSKRFRCLQQLKVAAAACSQCSLVCFCFCLVLPPLHILVSTSPAPGDVLFFPVRFTEYMILACCISDLELLA